MKLMNETNHVEVSGIQETGTFAIKTTAAAFQLLSSGLYSNKTRAVIRELACNAHDAHVMVKNNNPIEIKLPNALDTQFYVKDYGPGLSHDQIMRLYTTYFDSTKQDSNDFIGGFGVGSKSPFAYTDSFTIESRQNGKVRIYSAFVDEEQIPKIVYMSESETDEPNGLTVGFPVKNSDFRNFESEALYIAGWFDPVPIIKGTAAPVQIPDLIKLSDTVALPGKAYSIYEPMIRLGNVAYPLKKQSDISSNSENEELINWLFRQHVILTMPIGTVSVAASREALSYDKQTIANITKKLESAASLVDQHVINKLEQIDTSTRAGLNEGHQLLSQLNLNHLNLSEKSIADHIESNNVKQLPLLNQFLISQNKPLTLGSQFTQHIECKSTINLQLGRGRTSRVADIESFDMNMHYSSLSIDPSKEVYVIERDLHKSSPLSSRAWRSAYTKYLSHAGKYSSRAPICLIVEKPLDVKAEDYEKDKQELLDKLHIQEAIPLSNFLNDTDKQKLVKNTVKRTISAKSLQSKRLISVTEDTHVYWYCPEKAQDLTHIKQAQNISKYIDNNADDAEKIKPLLNNLDLPKNARIVAISSDDIADIKTFKHAKNLIEHIHTKLSSEEFKTYLKNTPKARTHLFGATRTLLTRRHDYNPADHLPKLAQSKIGKILIDFYNQIDLVDGRSPGITEKYEGLKILTSLDAACGNEYNIPTFINDATPINELFEKDYPIVNGYLNYLTQKYSSDINFDHVLKYINDCETPLIQNNNQLELTI